MKLFITVNDANLTSTLTNVIAGMQLVDLKTRNNKTCKLIFLNKFKIAWDNQSYKNFKVVKFFLMKICFVKSFAFFYETECKDFSIVKTDNNKKSIYKNLCKYQAFKICFLYDKHCKNKDTTKWRFVFVIVVHVSLGMLKSKK